MTEADGTGPLRLWQNARRTRSTSIPPTRTTTREKRRPLPGQHALPPRQPGSSGSDKPFLEAWRSTYAAFRPDTKARLVQEDLLVPTVQMVFRRSLQHVTSRDAT